MMTTMKLLTLATALAVFPTSAPSAGAVPYETRFKIVDPRGDDHGDGTMRYPQRDDLRSGDLDLVRLSAHPEKDGTRFEAVFARPIRGTEGPVVDFGGGALHEVARYGFYTFNLDIYIDTNRLPGVGSRSTLPGRNAEIEPGSAWEKAIVLTPRPAETRQGLKRLLLREIRRKKQADGERLAEARIEQLRGEIATNVESRVFFPTRISVGGRKISFFVPDAFLGGPARDTWSYVFAVSGADLEQRPDLHAGMNNAAFRGDALMILPLLPAPSPESFGGGRDGELELQPALVDIVVPKGLEQEKVLRSYDPNTRTLVQLPGVVPAEAGR